MARAPSTQGNPLVDNPALKTDLEKVADHVTEIDSVATAIEDGSFGAVHTDLEDIRTVGQNIGDVSLLAAIEHKLGMLADDLSNVDAVASSLGEVGNVSQNMATILLVHARMGDLLGVTSAIPDIEKVSQNEDNINEVAENVPEITTLVAHMADVHYLYENRDILHALYNDLATLIAVGNELDLIRDIHNDLDAIRNAQQLVDELDAQVVRLEEIESTVVSAESSVQAMTSQVTSDAAEVASDTLEVEANRVATEGHKNTAEQAKSAAEVSATESAGSAVAAAGSATSASISAASALSDADRAQSHVSDTRTNADEAALSAQSASDSMIAAATYRNNAKVSEDAAELAASEAEIAQAAAEAARDVTEVYRDAAQLSASTSEADAVSAAASEVEAKKWADLSSDNAEYVLRSGGAFTPIAGNEYPVLDDDKYDTSYLIAFSDSTASYLFTVGSLSGQTVYSQDVILWDASAGNWAVVFNPNSGSILEVNGKTGSVIELTGSDLTASSDDARELAAVALGTEQLALENEGDITRLRNGALTAAKSVTSESWEAATQVNFTGDAVGTCTIQGGESSPIEVAMTVAYSHTHEMTEVVGLSTALDSKLGVGQVAADSYKLGGKLAADYATQTDLQGYSRTGHGHVESDIVGLDKYTRAEVDSIAGAIEVKADTNQSVLTDIVAGDTTVGHALVADSISGLGSQSLVTTNTEQDITARKRFTGSDSLRLPVGTSAERIVGEVGSFRFNSETDSYEGYNAALGWFSFADVDINWGDLSGDISLQTDLQAALDGKLGVSDRAQDTSNLDGQPSSYYATQGSLDALQVAYDDTVILVAEHDTTLDAQQATLDSHASQISGLYGSNTSYDNRITQNESDIVDLGTAKLDVTATAADANLLGGLAPSAYAPKQHAHQIADVVGLQEALDNPVEEHSHKEADIVDLDKYDRAEVDEKIAEVEALAILGW